MSTLAMWLCLDLGGWKAAPVHAHFVSCELVLASFRKCKLLDLPFWYIWAVPSRRWLGGLILQQHLSDRGTVIFSISDLQVGICSTAEVRGCALSHQLTLPKPCVLRRSQLEASDS